MGCVQVPQYLGLVYEIVMDGRLRGRDSNYYIMELSDDRYAKHNVALDAGGRLY